MSGYIAGPAASETAGTFVLANNTTEQVILDIPNADRVVQDVNVRLNVVALTKNNAVFRFYVALDGVTYNEHNRITLAASSTEVHHSEPALASPFRVTLQSALAEGATRSIPYEMTQVRHRRRLRSSRIDDDRGNSARNHCQRHTNHDGAD